MRREDADAERLSPKREQESVVPRGEVWYVLDSFDRILAAIDESLKLVARGIEVDFARDEMGRHSASNEMDMAWESEDDEDDEVEGELSSGDRKVCEAFSILRKEFHIKFENMWS